MISKRKRIPTELQRQIFVEAGHRCAVPTCRAIEKQIHHIIPVEKGGKNEYHNLIALCANCHTRADKGETDRKSLRKYKDNLRYVIEKYSKFEIDLLIDLDRLPDNKARVVPAYTDLLFWRIKEDSLVEYTHTPHATSANLEAPDLPLIYTPDLIHITEKGRCFVNSMTQDKIGYEREDTS
jgi:hypothetical protein